MENWLILLVLKTFIIAIILFSLGSIIGFSNQTYTIVILARLLQASGGVLLLHLPWFQ